MSKHSSKTAQKKNTKKVSNQVCNYDFTLFDDITERDVRNTLKSYCKKYCFQLEKGEKTDRLHYQGRFSLKIRKRESECAKQFRSHWKDFHLSITSNENKNNDFYVLKDDTRIDGPFTDENEIFVPKDVAKMTTLRPWQEKLVNMLKTYDERTIDVLIDEDGNSGKSSIARFMAILQNAGFMPFCNDYKDIMRMCYDLGPRETYLIDLPRAINKDKLFQLFGAIETMKSGYCQDDRFKFKQRFFDRPRICIFTNVLPDMTLLSRDMWRLWKIVQNELVPYDTPTKNVLRKPNKIDPTDINFLSDSEEE